jgi:hypothetical protein
MLALKVPYDVLGTYFLLFFNPVCTHILTLPLQRTLKGPSWAKSAKHHAFQGCHAIYRKNAISVVMRTTSDYFPKHLQVKDQQKDPTDCIVETVYGALGL